jgi:hypothetical protein
VTTWLLCLASTVFDTHLSPSFWITKLLTFETYDDDAEEAPTKKHEQKKAGIQEENANLFQILTKKTG